MRLATPVWVCLLGLLLSACGGGGGGGGDSNSGRGSQRGDFTLSSNTVTLAGKVRGPIAVAALSVTLGDSAPATVVAGYRPGTTAPTWLHVSATGSGSTYNFVFNTVGSSSMVAGTYQTTITFATTDSSGNPLVTKDVQVTLTLRDGVVASGSSPLDATVGSSASTFTTNLYVNSPASIGWRATSNVPWLTVPGSGQGQGTSLVQLSINTSTLPAGDQQARVTITNIVDPTDAVTVIFTMRMAAPTLSLSAPTLLLGGQSGLDSRTGNVSFSINTGTNSHPWTVTTSTTSGGNWLNSNLANGSVSATQQALALSADVSSLGRGTYTGNVAIEVQVNGAPYTANVPVTLNVDSNRLVISATGVAFSSVPGRQVLTRTLTLANSLDLPGIAWHASSDQPWLQVTPLGNDANVTLTADPTSLAPGQYFANVEVTPDSSGVVNTQTVRVGLYVSNSAPTASIDIAVANAEFAASNPVVPEFYTLEGTSVRAYDAYSGALLRTLATITGTPQNMTTSDDGRVVYLLTDSINNEGHVIAIDAVNGGIQSTSVLPEIGFQQGGGRNGILYMRPDARPVVVAGAFAQYLDVTTGEVHQSARVDISSSSTVSANQRRMYTVVQPISPSETSVHDVRYSTLLNQGLVGREITSNSGHSDPGNRGNCGDIALSADQFRVHLACGGPYQFDVLNADTLVYLGALPGDAYPNNIETSWNGLVAAIATIGPPMTANLWIYDASGTQRALLGAGGNDVFVRTLRFSGDGTRLLTATSSGMRIQDAPIP